MKTVWASFLYQVSTSVTRRQVCNMAILYGCTQHILFVATARNIFPKVNPVNGSGQKRRQGLKCGYAECEAQRVKSGGFSEKGK